MAEWHLDDLAHELERHGWHVVAEQRRGDSDPWGRAGTWELARGGRHAWIDFDGADAGGLVTHPLERAYACKLRDADASLYFRRKQATATWRRELTAFAAALDVAVSQPG